MTNLSEIRVKLLNLLQQWQDRAITSQTLHREAEIIWESRSEWPDLPTQHRDSPVIEVLSHLDMMNHQRVLRNDASEIIDFLEATTDIVPDAWVRWKKYWEAIDYPSRERQFQSEYET